MYATRIRTPLTVGQSHSVSATQAHARSDTRDQRVQPHGQAGSREARDFQRARGCSRERIPSQ